MASAQVIHRSCHQPCLPTPPLSRETSSSPSRGARSTLRRRPEFLQNAHTSYLTTSEVQCSMVMRPPFFFLKDAIVALFAADAPWTFSGVQSALPQLFLPGAAELFMTFQRIQGLQSSACTLPPCVCPRRVARCTACRSLLRIQPCSPGCDKAMRITRFWHGQQSPAECLQAQCG